MLGVWPITSVEEREAVSFLILHLPTDGRVEVVIRVAGSVGDDGQPVIASDDAYQVCQGKMPG